MAWLHENKEEFRNAVLFAADQSRQTPATIEKDYYVTLILKGLKEKLPFIVFKGGTSLSKCYKVINRFSEDIDVTVDTRLSQSQMRNVKKVIQEVAAGLNIIILNLIYSPNTSNLQNMQCLSAYSAFYLCTEAVQS